MSDGLFDLYRIDKDYCPMDIIQIKYAFPNKHQAWVQYQRGLWSFFSDTGERCYDITLSDVNSRLRQIMSLP